MELKENQEGFYFNFVYKKPTKCLLHHNLSYKIAQTQSGSYVFIIFHLSKLHLIHPLASVPMQEGFTFKHGRELLANSFK